MSTEWVLGKVELDRKGRDGRLDRRIMKQQQIRGILSLKSLYILN
jgi:hypothetical protein